MCKVLRGYVHYSIERIKFDSVNSCFVDLLFFIWCIGVQDGCSFVGWMSFLTGFFSDVYENCGGKCYEV